MDLYFTRRCSDSRPGIVAWDGKSASPTDNTLLVDIAQGKFPGWKAITGSQQVTTVIPLRPHPLAMVNAFGFLMLTHYRLEVHYLANAPTMIYLARKQPQGNFMEGIPAILGTHTYPAENMYWSSFRI